jgi:hypothetical protein
MIQGNQAWMQALAQPAKQPLYVLQIPSFGIVITSFLLSAAPLVESGPGGYGVILYGIGLYGT